MFVVLCHVKTITCNRDHRNRQNNWLSLPNYLQILDSFQTFFRSTFVRSNRSDHTTHGFMEFNKQQLNLIESKRLKLTSVLVASQNFILHILKTRFSSISR